MDKKNGKFEKSTKYPQLMPLWASIFSDILGFTLFIPLLKAIQDDFGASPLQVGLILSINALFSFFFGPFLGKLSDRYGRKPILLISQFGTMFAFLLFAFSTNYWMIFASRILDGIFGGNYPISKAIIGDVVAPKDRSKQMTNIGVCHNVANLFGPAFSGILYKYTGFMGPGLFAAGLSLITIIITLTILEESAPAITGEILFYPSSVSNNDGNNKHNHTNNKDNQNNLNSYRSNNNINNLNHNFNSQTWKNPTSIRILIIWSAHTIAFFAFLSGFSLFVGNKIGIGVSQLGILLSIAGAFQLFVRFVVFNPMMSKFGEYNTLKFGLGLFILIFFFIGFVTEYYQIILILLAMSFAASSVRGILTGFLSRSVHPKFMGKVMGYNTSLDSFAQIIGPLISTGMIGAGLLIIYGIPSMIFSIISFVLIFSSLEFKYEKKNF